MEVEPLSNQEILAFRGLHYLQDVMDSYDVQMLRRLDGAWFAARPKDPPKPAPQAAPGRPFGRG